MKPNLFLGKAWIIVPQYLINKRSDLGEYSFLSRRKPGLKSAEYLMPGLFAFQYALTKLWENWVFIPDCVLGHSAGEYTAAVIAGIMSLEDGFNLVIARGV